MMMMIILWGTVLVDLSAVVLHGIGRIDPAQLFNLIFLTVAIADALRVIFVLWIFRNAARVKIGRLTGFHAFFNSTPMVRATTFLWIFGEFVMLANVGLDFAKGANVNQMSVVVILFFHLTLYPLRQSHASFNY